MDFTGYKLDYICSLDVNRRPKGNIYT